MRINQKILAAIFVIMAFPSADIYSQSIENVSPEIEEDKIYIYYDLLDISADQTVLVKVFMSKDGGETYGEPLKSVTGDVGLVTGPGKKKRIEWDVFNDLTELMSFNVKFKVIADLLGSGSDHHGSQPNSFTSARTVQLGLNTHFGYKNQLGYASFGMNVKGSVQLNQLGLGLRADYYRTFRQEINYTEASVVYPDTGFFWGYAGGAFIEYDFIKNRKYSLYPYLFIGQSKFVYTYNQDFREEEYFKYSVFGCFGIGFDVQVNRFFSLGMEAEYMLSPWVDLVPSEDPDEAMDGISLGIVVKFLIETQ